VKITLSHVTSTLTSSTGVLPQVAALSQQLCHLKDKGVTKFTVTIVKGGKEIGYERDKIN
jgi:hypothetical protein